MNGGFGKEFYRKGNSVKRSGRFSELRNWPISSADFPYESYGKNRAPFWPFLGEGVWAPCSPGPFVLFAA